MAQSLTDSASFTSGHVNAVAASPSYQAYQILRLGFTVAPIVAGLDKFFNLLVNWSNTFPGSSTISPVVAATS